MKRKNVILTSLFLITSTLLIALILVNLEFLNPFIFFPKNNISSYLAELKPLSENLISGNLILRDIAESKKCGDDNRCVEIKNDSDSWFSVYNIPSTLVYLNGYHGIKISLRSINGASGIDLIGNFSQSGQPWWKGYQKIVFLTDKGNIKINLHTGTQEEPLSLFTESTTNNGSDFITLFIFFDDQGKTFIVANEKNNLIKKIDIKSESKNTLLAGVFPEKKLNIGVSVAPFSSLQVKDFFIFSVPKKYSFQS